MWTALCVGCARSKIEALVGEMCTSTFGFQDGRMLGLYSRQAAALLQQDSRMVRLETCRLIASV